MPEGHTVRRLALDQGELFAGTPLAVSSPQGKFVGAHLVDGRVLLRTEAYGKHLFYVFPDDRLVHVHLGLYGKYAVGSLPPPEPRGLIRMRLVGETHWADLRGPGACEVLDPAQVADLIARQGPDPLRPGRRQGACLVADAPHQVARGRPAHGSVDLRGGGQRLSG